MFDMIVYAREINRALRKSLVGGAFTGAGYKGEIEKPGSKVVIFTPSAIDISDYTGVDLPVQTLVPGSQEITVNQAKGFAYEVDVLDQLKTEIQIAMEHVEEARYALADVADQHIFTQLTAQADLTVEADVSTVAGLKAALQEADQKLSEANVARSGRVLALPPALRILTADLFGTQVQSEQAVREGYIGRVHGFDLYESNNLPETTAYAGHPRGAVFASKLVKTKMEEDPGARFGTFIKGLYVYQAELFRPQMGCVITWTAPVE